MEIFEKEKRFHEELMSCVDRFSMEYDLTYPQIIGVLTTIKQQMLREFMEEEGEEDENENGIN